MKLTDALKMAFPIVLWLVRSLKDKKVQPEEALELLEIISKTAEPYVSENVLKILVEVLKWLIRAIQDNKIQPEEIEELVGIIQAYLGPAIRYENV